MHGKQIKIGVIAGEASGQLLASELVDELSNLMGNAPHLIGVGGDELHKYGLKTVFNPNEIALTGITSVVKSLPRLIQRIGQTADAIVESNPDCLLLIDSPDFSLRVAKRVKAKLPNLPVIKYVAPSVWAWRPGRAATMAEFVDHVLAILPFEPAVMEKLGGPKTHYVGHRLLGDNELTKIWNKNSGRHARNDDKLNLLILPGSRMGEVKSLMADFGRTVEILMARDNDLRVFVPTLPNLLDEVHRRSADWPITPIITTTREKQLEAYENADVALAASGTVTLELALAGIPAISCYKVDPVMKLATSMITTWSAALPNLIADQAIIQEFYNEQVRPGMLARCLESITEPASHKRRAIMDGYGVVRQRMQTEQTASKKAAQIVSSILKP